jgi:hypothetical protein
VTGGRKFARHHLLLDPDGTQPDYESGFAAMHGWAVLDTQEDCFSASSFARASPCKPPPPASRSQRCKFAIEPRRRFFRGHQVSGCLEQLGYQSVASATLGSEVGPMIGRHRLGLDQFGMQCSDLCFKHGHGRMIVTR